MAILKIDPGYDLNSDGDTIYKYYKICTLKTSVKLSPLLTHFETQFTEA